MHDFTQVRAGVLRLIRYILKTPRDVQVFNELQIPQLVCRSIDIILDNEEERVQAFKLVSYSVSIYSTLCRILGRYSNFIFPSSDSEDIINIAGNDQPINNPFACVVE